MTAGQGVDVMCAVCSLLGFQGVTASIWLKVCHIA